MGGFLVSIVGYLPLVTAFILFGLNFDNVRIFFLSSVFGYPLGSILGILLVDKIVFKNKKLNIIRIAVCAVLSVAGGVGVTMIGAIGGLGTIAIPAIVTFLGLVGYNIPLILTSEPTASK
jgi:hypothetical protein